MLKKMVFAVGLGMMAPAAAQAAWLYQELGSAFDDAKIHVAMGAVRNYALGLRCTGPAGGEVIFATPEDLKDVDPAAINAIGPMLLIRVDDTPPLKLPGEIEATDNGFRIVADAPDGLFAQVREAKIAVSAAIDMMGQTMHEQKFDVSGSTRAVEQMESACKAQ